MIRCYRTVLFFLTISLTAVICSAQSGDSSVLPMVRVDAIRADGNDPRLVALRETVESNILLTLRLTGRFVVSGADDASRDVFTGDESTADLRRRALEEGYDNIIFGSCTAVGSTYVVSVRAYDLATDRLTFDGSTTIESLFDTFDAVDEITLDMVDGFSGLRVTFGSIRLRRPGTGEPFTMLVNGVEISAAATELNRLPAGDHRLTFLQQRPLEEYQVELRVALGTDQLLDIDAPFPLFTELERAVIDRGVDAARRRAVYGAGDEGDLDAARELLKSPFFAVHRADEANRYLSWLEYAVAGPVRRQDMSPRSPRLAMPRGSTGIVPHRLPYTRSLTELLETTRSAATTGGDYVVSFRSITLDGDGVDWEGVPAIEDRIGDSGSTGRSDPAGEDLAEIRYAHDGEKLYVLFRTADGQYRQNNIVYKVHFYNGQAGLFFDFWSFVHEKPWVGWDPESTPGPDIPWETMEQSMRVAVGTGEGSVIEMAIPLRLLSRWEYFSPRMRNWCSVTLVKGENHINIDDPDSGIIVILPMAEIFHLAGTTN